MQGHGIENCFMGVACPLEKAQVVILPIAFGKTTTYGKGTEKGPQALIEASRNIELYDVETQSEVIHRGIYTAPELAPQTSEEMIEKVQQEVSMYLKQGKFVAALGGEHAVTYPLIQAHVKKHQLITVLQLDAHTDLIPAYEGNPYSHASVMARVHELPQVDRVVPVGIRSMAKEEAESAHLSQIFYAHELEKDEVWMDKVIQQLSDQVYVTFDLDVFDSSLMPATGTPEPGGLDWMMATKLLKKVAEQRQIVGFDVVELSPISHFHAPDYLAAKLVYKFLSYLFHSKEDSHVYCGVHEETL